MKFIHIADLHLDTPLVSLKNNRDLIKKRRTEHKQIFKDVIKLVKEENVDILFISGDFFEQKYVEKNTIEFIISNFQLIPNTKIFISPGNHDPYIKNSPYKTYKWPSNVVIFDSHISKYETESVDIYGFGFEDYEMYSEELIGFKIDNPEKMNVLVTHGNLDGNDKYNSIKTSDLKQFNYVALGHIHMQKLDNNIVYPGALVACGFDETGEHGLVIGEITNSEIKYEFRNMEYRHFEEINVDISKMKIPSDIDEELKLNDGIYKIILSGFRNIDINELQNFIYENYKNVCDIKDMTKLPYDLEKIATQKTLKGIFTRKMLELLKEQPEDEELIMKAIELTYSAF